MFGHNKMNFRLRLGIVLLLLSEHAFADAALGQPDALMVQAVNDHGDRLTDLELTIQTFRTELKLLGDENKDLKDRLKTLTLVCSNASMCCAPCQTTVTSMDNTNTPSPTVAKLTDNGITNLSLPPDVTNGTTVTKAMSVNASSTELHSTETTAVMTPHTQTTLATTRSSTRRDETTTTPSTTAPPTTAGTNIVFNDCEEAVRRGATQGGVVNVTLGSKGKSIPVFCQRDTNGAWLVIQRRFDGSQNFSKNWNAYKDGFGDINGEFWLGNENIYQLTSNTDYTLRIEMEDWASNKAHAVYTHFHIENEINYYRLFVGSYNGTAGDSFHYPGSYLLQHFQIPFSTPDRDNDRSLQKCADVLKSGWWFNDCYSSNLNGKYLHQPYGQRMMGESYGQPTMEGTGVEWYPYKRRQYSMKRVEMKIQLSQMSSMG